jgi:hypothetical protein
MMQKDFQDENAVGITLGLAGLGVGRGDVEAAFISKAGGRKVGRACSRGAMRCAVCKEKSKSQSKGEVKEV